jgi:hypothetical protein
MESAALFARGAVRWPRMSPSLLAMLASIP